MMNELMNKRVGNGMPEREEIRYRGKGTILTRKRRSTPPP
jgi:hypothetical protein